MSIEHSHILVAYKQNIMSHGLISPHQSDCSSGTLIVLHTYHINIIIVCSIRQIAHIIMLINQIQAWHGLNYQHVPQNGIQPQFTGPFSS